MATCEGCCHLTGAMLNLAAEAADRARISEEFGTSQERVNSLRQASLCLQY
jgi:two-component sensor histidine kinase